MMHEREAFSYGLRSHSGGEVVRSVDGESRKSDHAGAASTSP